MWRLSGDDAEIVTRVVLQNAGDLPFYSTMRRARGFAVGFERAILCGAFGFESFDEDDRFCTNRDKRRGAPFPFVSRDSMLESRIEITCFSGRYLKTECCRN
jgi:hypothetical protein